MLRLTLAAAFLALAACSASDVSTACTADADCASGLCYTTSTPGYCTSACQTEGSTSECPSGTICKPIRGGAVRCLLVCEAASDCPDNSDCNSVAGASQRACEPVR